MKPKPLAIAFAVAACSYTLPVPAANTDEIILQLTPAGQFKPVDGREMLVPFWFIDRAVATQVIDRFNQRNQPVVIDYEHQTLNKEQNGMPAPAAAWMRELMWRDGEGLFARVELTANARNAIAAKEYLYISPVFRYNRKGDVTEIEMAALTNFPAVHGMRALELRAAACFGLHENTDHEEMDMKLLAALIAALGMKDDTTEEQAVAALTARLNDDPLKKLREALGAKAEAGEEDLVAACTALRTHKPNPAEYVPVSVVETIKGELAVLTSKMAERESTDTEADIQSALADGRLLPSMENWARDLGKSDRAALTSYLGAAQPIAALVASQTKGKKPADNETGLTEEELAVCSNMGISAEKFKENKPKA